MQRTLPKDILDLIGKYKYYAELNHEILRFLFDRYLENIDFTYEDLVEKSEDINYIFEICEMKTRLIVPDEYESQNPEQVFNLNLESNPRDDIPDGLLLELMNYLLHIVSERWNDCEDVSRSIRKINNFLIEKDSKIRVIISGTYKIPEAEAILMR